MTTNTASAPAGVRWGATPAEWAHFQSKLGLEADLLPVVSNPAAVISPGSTLKALGKVPSRYNAEGKVVGFPKWTEHRATAVMIAGWSAQPDYGIALQCRQVRAIDVDIEDPALAGQVLDRLQQLLGPQPIRARANSSKFLVAFRLPGQMSKRVIRTGEGVIEFLANGQQFIAVGTHPKGVRYEWQGGLPAEMPTICLEQFERAWAALVVEFGLGSAPVAERAPRLRGPDLDLPDPVADFLYANGLVSAEGRDGQLHIECPWVDEHTMGEADDGSTTYFRAGSNGYQQGHFRCLHSHCEDRRDDEFIAALGYFQDAFDELPESDAETPAHQFYAYLPDHKYIYRPTRSLWPGISVDRHLATKIDGASPSAWLDRHRAVHQIIWCPGEGELLEDCSLQDGDRVHLKGHRAYNLYHAPKLPHGDANRAGMWRDHLRKIYPEEGHAEHIECWLAQRVQYPGIKINHALVLGGNQGIGKDTLLEPVKRAVGGWNWADVSPTDLLGQFNPWAKSVILRVNETRNLGTIDRFAFYEKSKTLIAAPPDVILCNEKHTQQQSVVNVMGVIYTTNNKIDGIHLPADDRRHFVAWSTAVKEDFPDSYWSELWDWLEAHWGDVAAFLGELDLSRFDPKAPPPKTEAFYEIVFANNDPRDTELAAVVEELGRPPALTLRDLTDALDRRDGLEQGDLRNVLCDGKSRRQVPHLLERAGYVQTRNADSKDQLWSVAGRRQAIYCSKDLGSSARLVAARERAALPVREHVGK